MIGKLTYMSPEQVSRRRVDAVSDVYSLGATLYEVLTLRPPFDGESDHEIQNGILFEDPTSPRKLNPRIHRDLETIVLHALEKNPERRYRSAGELAADLRRLLRFEPIKARPRSTLTRVARHARRHPAVAALVVVSALAVLAFGGFVVSSRYNARLEELLAQAEEAQYFQHIATANAAWHEADLRRVERLLDNCPPGYQHNWKWRYLKRQCHPALFALGPPNRDEARAVAFSPDGTKLAVGRSDTSVEIWDVASRKVIHTFGGHESSLRYVVFSQDGTRIASATLGASVRVWEVVTGRPVFGPRPAGRCVAFSPDGRRIAAGNDQMMGVWDATTDQIVLSIAPGRPEDFWRVSDVVFSGDRLIAGTQRVHVWDVDTGDEVPSPVTRHRGSLRGIAVSPDGRRLASVGGDRTTRLWALDTGEPLIVLRGHTDEVLDVTFSDHGNWLASASLDGTIRLYDARPLTPESSIEREALGALEFTFGKPLSKDDSIAYLKECPTLRAEAREMALGWIDRYREETDPERYDEAAWNTVRRPYLNEFQYGFALQQARRAYELAPDEVKYQIALGAAQYRLGRREDALATLARVKASMEATAMDDAETRARLRVVEALVAEPDAE